MLRDGYRAAQNSIREKIINFHDQERFDDDREKALGVWFASHGDDQSDDFSVPRFMDWFIYDYRLKEYGKSLIDLFYEEERHSLEGLEGEVLEGSLGTFMGLYEVTRVEEGRGVGLREVVTGEEYFANDVTGSRNLVKWDVVVVRVTGVKGRYGLEGAALVFHQRAKKELIRFGKDLLREHRRRNPNASWRDLMKEKAHLFNSFPGMVGTRAKKEVVTPEGDEIAPSRAVYRVKDPEKVLAGLEKVEAVLKLEETVDPDGQIEEAHFKWFTQMEEGGGGRKRRSEGVVLSTRFLQEVGDKPLHCMGDIEMDRQELTLECLSKERLEKGRKLLQASLGESIEHVSSSFLGLEEALEEGSWSEEHLPGAREPEDLPPEVSRRILLDFLEDHYQSWVDTPLPALKGKTPREASSTEEGRAMLEEVLKVIENLEERRRKEEGVGYPVERIRRDLEENKSGISMIDPTSFYSGESEKTKLNWFCYELAMNIYDEVTKDLGEPLRKHGIDERAIADFSIRVSKGMKNTILRKLSKRVDKVHISYQMVESNLPNLGDDELVNEVLDAIVRAWDNLLSVCEACPTRCISERDEYCTMFDEGPY